MAENKKSKEYDLEDRTFAFAQNCRVLVRKIVKDIPNIEDSKQLVRASGSVGANYIEANEALSKKDFNMRIKISRKESKESRYWLRLLYIQEAELDKSRQEFVQESQELMNIFGAILRKTEKSFEN